MIIIIKLSTRNVFKKKNFLKSMRRRKLDNLIPIGYTAINILTIDSWRRSLNNEILNNELKRKQEMIENLVKATKELQSVQEKLIREEVKHVAEIGNIKDNLSLINQDINNINSAINTGNSELIKTGLQSVEKSITQTTNMITDILSKVNGSGNSSGNISQMGTDIFKLLGDIINSYQDFLNSLSPLEMSAVVQIIIAITVL